MSLSRIDGWTRMDLVREAEKLGIERAGDLSRAELVRLLQRADRSYRRPPSALGAARALFNRVVDLARTAIPRGQEPPRESAPAWGPGARASSVPPAPLPIEPRAPSTRVLDERGGSIQDGRDSALVPGPTAVADLRPDHAREAVVERGDGPVATERGQTKLATDATVGDADDETDDAPRNGKKSKKKRKLKKKHKLKSEKAREAQLRQTSRAGDDEIPDDEPIQTRTMARLLTEQGYHQRALAIYAKLRADDPEDAELEREEAEIRTRLVEDAGANGPESVGGGEVAAVSVDDCTLLVSWEVDEKGVDRATDVLGETGALTARLMITAPDPGHVVMTESRDRNGVALDGEWLVRDLPAGARVTASIGLLRGSRFVSIAHAPPVELAPKH